MKSSSQLFLTGVKPFNAAFMNKNSAEGYVATAKHFPLDNTSGYVQQREK